MGMLTLLLLILRMIALSSTCLQTIPGGNPSTGTTTSPTVTTTTTGTNDCCPALTQTLTTLPFPDGTLTFAYNSDTCRMTATATCSTNDPTLDLNAAIVGNTDNFLDFNPDSVSVQFTCSGGRWQFTTGANTLVIDTVECVLTNPAT